MWQPGDVNAWRGVFRGRVWHVQPTVVVRDSPEELVLTLLPGTECIADENYPKGKNIGKHRWEFMENDWTLAKYTWRTNRLLLILEPRKYYSTIHFWDHESHEFLCYYVNFQLPFQRTHCGIDTLDLELDLVIRPNLSYEWKDVKDYDLCLKAGMIQPEWAREIDKAKEDVFERISKGGYPFNGAWLDWQPDPAWEPPNLPEGWDRV
jgi:predicted RNA-binding protein associated with RNAse of E/G family